MEEIWKPCVGIPDYEVSDQGNVRSWVYRGKRLCYPKSIKLTSHPDGYKKFGAGKKTYLVHQQVLLAFRGQPQPKQICRHLNGDPSDNRLDNLQWGTRRENNQDTAKHYRYHSQLLTADEAWGVKLLLSLKVGGEIIRRVYPAANTDMISCIKLSKTWAWLPFP